MAAGRPSLWAGGWGGGRGWPTRSLPSSASILHCNQRFWSLTLFMQLSVLGGRQHGVVQIFSACYRPGRSPGGKGWGGRKLLPSFTCVQGLGTPSFENRPENVSVTPETGSSGGDRESYRNPRVEQRSWERGAQTRTAAETKMGEEGSELEGVERDRGLELGPGDAAPLALLGWATPGPSHLSQQGARDSQDRVESAT